MKYIKITYSNGYYGCNEYEYTEVADKKEADVFLSEGIQNYSFFWPDSRFVDDEYDDDQIDEYQERIYEYSYWEEISEKEYRENK